MTSTEIVAIPALIISIFSFVFTIYIDNKNRKQNKENAMAIFFKELFFNIIVRELPVKLLEFEKADDKHKILILDDIDNILITILDNSIFYKYYDNEFYIKIKNNIINLQDECFKISNLISKRTYRADNNYIEKKLADLYTTMISYYSSM